jgi:hypothetical protein
VGKKRRGHDERNLTHQGSQAAFFLGRMRATSAGSCDAGASRVEFKGALRLEEPGNSFTLITAGTLEPFCATHFAVTSKCIKLRTNMVRDGTSRGNFHSTVPCTHLANEGVL